MIITDYYKFEKTALLSASRMDCENKKKSYPEFEEKRKTRGNKQTAKKDANFVGALTCCYGNVPERFGNDARRKADKSVSIGSKNLSSVYVPDVTLPYAFGDVQGTTDAILFVFDDAFGVYKVGLPESIDLHISNPNYLWISEAELNTLENCWPEIRFCILRKDWEFYKCYDINCDCAIRE